MTAHYDAGRGRIVIALSTGVELGLAPRDVEGLAGASVDSLKSIKIDNQGFGIHFPKLDADLYVPALLEGVLGSPALDGCTIGRCRRPGAQFREGDSSARERPAGRSSPQVRHEHLTREQRAEISREAAAGRWKRD